MTEAPPLRNAAEWASQNRIMPPGSPIPGPFDTTSTPYMIPVCIAFSCPIYSRITFVMGTQMGKSATMQNVIGHRLDDEPAPIIYVGPTESNINNVVEPKILEMITEAKSLYLKFDKKSPKHKKRIAGVSLRFAWAGSATELASDSAVITLVDELDRPDENSTGEGDLGEIAEARGDAYADSKLGLTSTPTHGNVSTFRHPDTGLVHWQVSAKGKVSSPIWLQWEQGTRHEWAVPCPDCDQYFVPRSDLLWWPGKGTDQECTPAQAVSSARLTCPHCGTQIEDSKRRGMNKRGVALAPGQNASIHDDGHAVVSQGDVLTIIPFHSMIHPLDENDHFSIWVSGLCSFSSKKSYGYLARKLLSALKSGDPNKILTVYNTGFGEVYAVAGEAPDWEEVYALRSNYASCELPDGVHTLIATVDVQKNRLVYVVRGWLDGMSSRLIEFGELWGDTDKPEVWHELDEIMEREWGGLEIKMIGVDAGYRDDEVYAWVRKYKSRARALMGLQKMDKPFGMVRVEVDKNGKVRKRGDKRWNFNTTTSKAWVHSRVRWVRGTVGDWLLPSDVTKDYCKQIVAEEFNEEKGAYDRISKDNHYLDCEGMNFMVAKMLKLDRKKASSPDGDVVLSESASDEEADEQDDEPVERKKVKRKQKRRTSSRKSGNFATSW